MLKRSKVLVMLLVVTVLCASIGFAAVSDTLNADGNIKVDAENTELGTQFDTNVIFLSATDDVDSKDVFIIDTTDKDTITVTIDGELKTVGNSVTVTAVIKNANTGAASLSLDSATAMTTKSVFIDAAECVKATATLSANEIASGAENVTLTIKIEVIKTPAADIDGSYAFDVIATAK